MKPRIYWAFCLTLVLFVKIARAQEIAARHRNDFDFATGARTLLFGKLVLVPVLAALGLKFLALLPIVLAKIVLLSGMNFLSSNLNLIISTLFGLKNFLGKYGLWAQEDTSKHPDIQAFAELANQPILQPSFRYEYMVDKGINRSPLVTKVFNGFVPSEGGLDPQYKLSTFDRRTRADDKRYVRTSGPGKYKCYWSQDGSESIVKPDVAFSRRKYNLADRPRQRFGFVQQDLYGGLNPEINPPPQLYQPLATYEPYQTINDLDRQVATQTSDAANSGDFTSTQPFTHHHTNEVKVDENYENQPLVYLLRQEAAAKFKDDDVRDAESEISGTV